MFCTKCGAKNEEDGKFCYSCGNPLKAAEVEMQTVPETTVSHGDNENTYWENPSLSNPVQQVQAPVQQAQAPVQQVQAPVQQAQAPVQQYQTPVQQYYNPGQPVPPKNIYQPGADGNGIQKAKNFKPIIIVPVIAIIAIIAIVVIIASRSNKGVLDNIISAVQGTLKADSFEFDAEAYTEDEYGKDGGSIDGIVEYDFDKEKLNFDVGMEDERTILYDGVAYEIEDGEIWYDSDISYELGLIFDYYKKNKDSLDSLSDIDWEGAADEVGISLDFDIEVLQKCIKEFEKNMNDTKYIKSVCKNYEKKTTSEGTLYSFDVDVPKFVKSLVETFQPILDEYVEERDIDYLYDELDAVDECVIEIIIKSDKLVGFNANLSVNDPDYGKQSFEAEVTIDNYGKASLDVDEIEGFIEDYDSSSDW